MKKAKIALGFPIMASGLLIMSAGSAIFVFGCWLAEQKQRLSVFGRKR